MQYKARGRGDHACEVEVHPKLRCVGHDVSDFALDAGKERCAFGQDMVLIWLR
jgi:hypothetical protein